MAGPPQTDQGWIVVGQFAGAHGVRGGFKIRSFTDNPSDVAAYGQVVTEAGQSLSLKLEREVKPSVFLASAPEISSREACDAFKGALLRVSRDVLPAPEEDEFYHTDLVGLKAQTADRQPAGVVRAVVDYGAGEILELANVPDRKGIVLIPFTLAAVPDINIQAGTVTVVIGDPEPEGDEGATLAPTDDPTQG